ENITIDSAQYPTTRTFHRGEPASDYLASAITVIEEYRSARGLPTRGYHLDITSDLDHQGKKLGLGASGAITVAAITAIAGLYGLSLTNLQLFRLALCAPVQISPRASGGDLAVSTFGGWVHYTSPD